MTWNVKCQIHKMSNVMKCPMSNVVKCQMSWNVKCHEVGRIGRICQFGRIGRTSLRQPPDIPQTPPNTLQTPTRHPTDTFLKPQTPFSPDNLQKPSRHAPNNLQTTPKTPALQQQSYLVIFDHKFWSCFWSKFNFGTERRSQQNHQMRGGGGCGHLLLTFLSKWIFFVKIDSW